MYITKRIELEFHTKDSKYLWKLEKELDNTFIDFKPDIIVYNAGTDCLINDPLGCLSITPNVGLIFVHFHNLGDN